MARKSILFDENGIFGVPCRMCGCQIIRNENAVIQGRSVLSTCKKCHSIWRKGNKGDSWSDYWKNNADVIRNKNLQKLFGINSEYYNKLLIEQGGVCYICKKVNENGHRLSVDHDHKTKKVRSLLCHNCNLILGHCDENPEILRKLILYIEKHSSTIETKDYHDGFVDSLIM